MEKELRAAYSRENCVGYYTPEESEKVLHEHLESTVLSILHINIRSLNANYLKLLEIIDLYNNNLDVIVLSEIWITNINYFDNVFTDYNFFFCIP